MKINRRKFLEHAVAGAGGLLLGCAADGPDPIEKAPPSRLAPAHHEASETVALGKTKIQLSRVGMGTGMRGGRRQSNQTRLGKEKLEALIRHAYDRGVRWFDLADMYGSHPFLVPALKGIPRENYVIVSKIWWRRRGGLPERRRDPADVCVQRFCKEICTDYIDVVLLHCVTSRDWPATHPIVDPTKAFSTRPRGRSAVVYLPARKSNSAHPQWVDEPSKWRPRESGARCGGVTTATLAPPARRRAAARPHPR